jgi:two-component system response regulator YesN
MYKVILVDDEILVREAISAKVSWEALGYELVGSFENGKQAIEFLEEQPVDVVLTDICMPYMDGMVLSKYLFENAPETKIIIFSGYNDFEYAKKAIQYKVSEYILKPVTKKELQEVLSDLKDKLNKQRQSEQTMQKLTKAYREYTRNESLIISNELSRLVRGTQDVTISVKKLEEYGINVSSSYYKVAVADIDIYSEFGTADIETKKESALMAFVLENISSEILTKHHLGFAFHDSDEKVCMLLCLPNAHSSGDRLKEVLGEIQNYITATMKLSVSIGIGELVNQISDLAKSYNSAKEVLSFRYSNGEGVILDVVDKAPLSSVEFTVAHLNEIAESLKNGNKKQVELELDKLSEYIRQHRITKSIIISSLHQFIRIMSEELQKIDDTYVPEPELFAQISNSKTFAEALERLHPFVNDIFDKRENIGESNEERLVKQTLEFVKNRYSDAALSLNDVCEYLSISTSRFSTVFKQGTGMTFMEVLTNERMEKAKQLLSMTNMKNYEIAEKVGYNDAHYFSIAFKKTTGLSPKEYSKKYSR